MCVCSSVVALEAVNSVQLVLFVGEAAEPHSSFCGTAAPARAGDGITDAAVGQPTGVAAVVTQQLPGGVHLANLGDLSAVFLTRSDRLVVGQLRRVDQPNLKHAVSKFK
eukprot:superscaffoldBa00002019_g12894